MSFFGRWNFALTAAVLLAASTGCSPMDQGPVDEEKEPHYVLGKSRVNAFDYPGAIDAFTESLEANPHSAQAHYQLAMLYENQESDPAAAIYHYQQYLKYDPQAGNGDIIAQHIASCKQQLAADVLQLPSAPAAQQQLEKLTEENRRLQDQLSRWQAYYTAQLAALKTNPPAPPNNGYAASPSGAGAPLGETLRQTPPTPLSTTETAARPHQALPPKAAQPRSHIVAGGETLASIARKQGVALSALEAANPGVNPRKLKAGQVLNLPAP